MYLKLIEEAHMGHWRTEMKHDLLCLEGIDLIL
jgi:hypothetical protein